MDDALEISILGGTRLRALGQAPPPEEPRCPSRLPSLLSTEDAAVWKEMLDTKSQVKKRCISMAPSSPPHAESEAPSPQPPKIFEWSHVVDAYTFLLHDGYHDDDGSAVEPAPAADMDARDLSFIHNVLQPTLLHRDEVLAPRLLFALQHHRAPLHIIGLILDEMVSLAHLPTTDVFFAIEAGVRDIQQEYHQHNKTNDAHQAPTSPSKSTSLTIDDLLRIKRRIVLTHQFGMLFCLFLLNEIVSSVQIYGGSAALSILWKHRPNQQQGSGGGGVRDDGSQSAGSNDGEVRVADGEEDDALVPCVGIPMTHIISLATDNNQTTATTLPPRGSKRPRTEEDGVVVPASHFAGFIRSIEMVSTAVIEAIMMLAGYGTNPPPSTTTSSQSLSSSSASLVFAELQQHQRQQQGRGGEYSKSAVRVYSGVVVQWLVTIIQGWYSDGALRPSDTTPSLHPLVGLTKRFAVQERASQPQVKYLSEALLNHPTIKILLPSQRRRVTLVEKYPYLF